MARRIPVPVLRAHDIPTPAVGFTSLVDAYRSHPIESLLEVAERLMVREVMDHTGANQRMAVIILGLTVRQMHYLAKKHGYSREDTQPMSAVGRRIRAAATGRPAA